MAAGLFSFPTHVFLMTGSCSLVTNWRNNCSKCDSRRSIFSRRTCAAALMDWTPAWGSVWCGALLVPGGQVSTGTGADQSLLSPESGASCCPAFRHQRRLVSARFDKLATVSRGEFKRTLTRNLRHLVYPRRHLFATSSANPDPAQLEVHRWNDLPDPPC